MFPQNNLDTFISCIKGRIVLPSNPDYDQDRQDFNGAFQAYPKIIVYCVSYADVRLSLAFAQDHQLWAVARSGGHSLTGYSIPFGSIKIATNSRIK